MNTERDDIRLDELFKKKLESAEVLPGPTFNSTMMKKLARREFMTFNPTKINIFYLGGAFVASTVAVLMLSLADKKISLDNQPDFATENIVILEDRDVAANQIHVIAEVPEALEQSVKTVATTKTANSVNNISTVKNNTETIIENNQSLDLDPMTLDLSATKINREPLIDNRLIISSINNAKLFIPSALKGCAPFSVNFVVALEKIDSCRWSFGGNGVSYEKSPTWVFTTPGDFRVSLEAFSSGKLVGEYSEVITVYPRPTARFEISPDQVVIPDDMVRFINYSSGAIRYQWDFGDGSGSQQFEPLYQYKKFDNYTVTFKAYNEYGCADSVVLYNAFADSKCYIEFPNAFIPNNNGPSGGVYSQKSDESVHIFHPVSFGIIEYQLKIFSRRGILIFESSDIDIGWDGYFNGQLCESGVYVWQVSGKCRNGESFFKRGDVTLFKN